MTFRDRKLIAKYTLEILFDKLDKLDVIMVFSVFYSTNFLKKVVQEGGPCRIYVGATESVFYCN